ncbi:SRPBCC domain-containing protein [uncultured Phenylobacterium sp.]|uniref:SRPBCC family protein n=1 Tax=uncultured Phenylobacterium sp. TaxID=349273 RepID=UPI0025FCA279|nr:SRPBCC domain-containing protein [uncultured Phenylobacterium sp.]
MVEDLTSIIEIAAPREAVWRALTEPALVTQWMGCLRFQPIAGHIFYLQPDRARRSADDVSDAIACRIEILDAPRRISFSWGFPDVPDTWVDIRLRRIPGGTYVRLVHSGWNQFDDRETEDVRGGLGHAWHSVALPRLRQVVEQSGPQWALSP